MCFGPDIANNSDPVPVQSLPLSSALQTIACDPMDAGHGPDDCKVKLPVHWQCCGSAPTRSRPPAGPCHYPPNGMLAGDDDYDARVLAAPCQPEPECQRQPEWAGPGPAAHYNAMIITWGCRVQVGNGIVELEAVDLQFEPYRWRPCGVTWDSSRTVVVIKLRRTSALQCHDALISFKTNPLCTLFCQEKNELSMNVGETVDISV